MLGYNNFITYLVTLYEELIVPKRSPRQQHKIIEVSWFLDKGAIDNGYI